MAKKKSEEAGAVDLAGPEGMTVENREVSIDLLHPHPRNYNGHDKENIKRLSQSLLRFGQPRSIVAWRNPDDDLLYILAGHGVTEAARGLGWKTIRADIWEGCDEITALAYLVADNEHARDSDPDKAALALIIDEVSQYDDELLAAMSFDQDKFDALLAEAEQAAGLYAGEAGGAYGDGAGGGGGGGGGESGGADDDDPGNERSIEDYPVTDLLAPYPWFGGKRGVAGSIWARFGDVKNYVEPFFGSGAVLLSRPNVTGIETINDFDGFVANFWRAVALAPDEVAGYVDWPVNENDLFSRHLWLVQQRQTLTERLHTDPEYFDAKIAGWWCWGCCNWIGTGWCDGDGPWRVEGDGVTNGNAGQGVNRQLPHLGNAGQGVNTDGQCEQWSEHLTDMMRRLSDRLRRVRVCCGDWSRVATSSVTDRHGLTGIFLDPPYAEGAMEYSVGGNADASIMNDVRSWCIENGDNQNLRIAFCGYEPLSMPAGWTALRWTARKGYQNAENAVNSRREIVWFSPHCLKPERAP